LPEIKPQSPIKEIPFPEENFQSPIEEIPLPEEKFQSPIEEILLPEEKFQSPIEEIPLPEEKAQSPIKEITSPLIEEKPQPISKTPILHEFVPPAPKFKSNLKKIIHEERKLSSTKPERVQSEARPNPSIEPLEEVKEKESQN
jgi:hypothetical protein